MSMTDTFEGVAGRVEITVHPNGVLYILFSGELDASAGPWIGERLRKHIAAMPRVTLFWDMGPLVHYHPVVRVEAKRVVMDYLERMDAIHVYAASRVIRMVISVANMVLGGVLTLHTERAGFDNRYSAARMAA